MFCVFVVLTAAAAAVVAAAAAAAALRVQSATAKQKQRLTE